MQKRNVERPDVRKAEIVRLAKGLFLEKGYDAVSVREIVQATDSAGSPGLFYYYFKSKRDVYKEVLDSTVKEELLKRGDLAYGSRTIEEKILGSLKALQSDFQNLKKLLQNGKNRNVVSELSERFVDGEIPLAEEMITELIASNGGKNPIINRAHCKDLARFIVYGMNGILRGELSTDGSEELESELFTYMRSLVSKLIDINI